MSANSDFDELIILHVMDTLPVLAALDEDDTYTARELCPELWAEFSDDGQSIGIRISALVRAGRLPLIHAGFNSSRWNIYRINHSAIT